eukprot:TRINITY_DN146_c0_g1_i1.p1 TRINITY_DN146_c0_g1~~TRINITY_DN146_c0_g1_i1.p1  ORF type:complete len:275 (-),score=-13.28 TRINITY_DN146_c0_g1_i1:169-993(-)
MAENDNLLRLNQAFSAIKQVLKEKLSKYEDFTRNNTRAIPVPNTGHYIYPENSIETDVAFFGLLFSELYETLSSAAEETRKQATATKKGHSKIKPIVTSQHKHIPEMKLIGQWIKSNPKSYAYFKAMYKCILHEQGPTITCSKPTDNFGANADTTFEEFVSGEVMHTFRNAFAHIKLSYKNAESVASYLDAQYGELVTCFSKSEWVTNLAKEFTPNSYTLLLLDGFKDNSTSSWKYLRCVVANFADLRYNLHLFLKTLVEEEKDWRDVFGNKIE